MSEVTFSGRTVNLDESPVVEMNGMTAERQRELLKCTGLGQTVLLSANAEASFDDPTSKAQPHVAIHVHAPKSGGTSAPDASGGASPIQGMAAKSKQAIAAHQGEAPPDDEAGESDNDEAIEQFLQTLPDDITPDDLLQYLEQNSGVSSDSPETPPAAHAPPPTTPPASGHGGPPKFSMTAFDMFSGHAKFGGSGSGPFADGNNPQVATDASAKAHKASLQANSSGNKVDHARAADAHSDAAKKNSEIAARASKAGNASKATVHNAMAVHHNALAAHHKSQA